MTTIRALHIPAQLFRPLEFVELPAAGSEANAEVGFAKLYELLDVRMLQVLRVALPGFDGEWCLFCDDEGRLTNEPAPNLRATLLTNYPYMLVGNIAVVAVDGRTGADQSVPADMLDTLASMEFSFKWR